MSEDANAAEVLATASPDDAWTRPLTAEEAAAWLAHAASHPDEQAEMLDLIRWFTTRYPTPEARLIYMRRKTREALATQSLAARRT
jgi:hypothetical protein